PGLLTIFSHWFLAGQKPPRDKFIRLINNPRNASCLKGQTAKPRMVCLNDLFFQGEDRREESSQGQRYIVTISTTFTNDRGLETTDTQQMEFGSHDNA